MTTLRSESYKTNGFEFQHEAESIAFDTECVTSGSSSGEGIHGSRGLVVPARFWQEHNNRIRRQTETPSFDISSILAYDHEHQCYFNLVDKGY